MIILRILFLLIPDIVGALLGLLAYAMWGEKIEFLAPGMAVVWIKDESWLARTFPRWGGTTLSGHVVVAVHDDTGDDSRRLRHEHVHVEQFELLGLLGLVVGAPACGVHVLLGIFVWGLTPLLGYLAALVVGLTYKRDYYQGNFMERSAFALEREK